MEEKSTRLAQKTKTNSTKSGKKKSKNGKYQKRTKGMSGESRHQAIEENTLQSFQPDLFCHALWQEVKKAIQS